MTAGRYTQVVPGGNLLLEAADGTLRKVDVRGKAPEYPRIKSQIMFGN